MDATRRCALVLAMALAPTAGECQPRWDLAGTVGLFAGHRTGGEGGGYHQDWFQAAQGGVVAGQYLSRHLKIELEASATTGGEQYLSRRIDLPGVPYPYWISSHATTSVRSVGAVVGWQFRDNEWVHPFVQAGIAADADHVVLYTPEQYFYGDPRIGPPERLVAAASTAVSTRRRIRPVVAGGAKLYFRERAFVRTESRLTLDRGRPNLALRLGVGLDF